MNKNEFLNALQKRLAGISQADIDRSLEYYAELLDDRIEEGIAEEDAVASLPPMDEIVSQIVGEVPITKLIGEKLKPKRELKGWEIAMLIIGSPLWISVLAVIVSLIVTVFAVVWSALITVYAVIFAFAVSGFSMTISGLARVFAGQISNGIMFMGVGLMLFGLAILGFELTKKLPKFFILATKTMWIWIKKLFVKEEKV